MYTHKLKWRKVRRVGWSEGGCRRLPVWKPYFRFEVPRRDRLSCKMPCTYIRFGWNGRAVYAIYVTSLSAGTRENSWKSLFFATHQSTVKCATRITTFRMGSAILTVLQRTLTLCSSCGERFKNAATASWRCWELEFTLLMTRVAFRIENMYDLARSKVCQVTLPPVLSPLSQGGNQHLPGEDTVK